MFNTYYFFLRHFKYYFLYYFICWLVDRFYYLRSLQIGHIFTQVEYIYIPRQKSNLHIWRILHDYEHRYSTVLFYLEEISLPDRLYEILYHFDFKILNLDNEYTNETDNVNTEKIINLVFLFDTKICSYLYHRKY